MQDLEKGYLKSKVVVALLMGVAGIVFFLAPYVAGVDDVKRHLKDYPTFVLQNSERNASQDQRIVLLERDIEAGEAHRKRVEIQMQKVVDHLTRLELALIREVRKQKQVVKLLRKY